MYPLRSSASRLTDNQPIALYAADLDAEGVRCALAEANPERRPEFHAVEIVRSATEQHRQAKSAASRRRADGEA